MSSIITIIPLATAYLEAPLLSSEVISVVQDAKTRGKKVLMFYSRRGNARAWLCADCGHYEKCPHCDIAFAYHTTPTKRLVCHQCNTVAPFPIVCPKCGSSHINPIGIGIQQIEENLVRILGSHYNILRVDSDTKEKSKDIYERIPLNDIILSTRVGTSIVHPDIDTVIWLSFELNLGVPSYSIEEEIWNEIQYYKKQQLSLYIQTYTPEHPLLEEVLNGNTRTFFEYIKNERKEFHYPPYGEFATIRIHDEKKEKVEDMIRRIVNKIHLIKNNSTFVAFDTTLVEKVAGEWQQKIILKDKKLGYLIEGLEVEILRNRMVSLEWN